MNPMEESQNKDRKESNTMTKESIAITEDQKMTKQLRVRMFVGGAMQKNKKKTKASAQAVPEVDPDHA